MTEVQAPEVQNTATAAETPVNIPAASFADAVGASPVTETPASTASAEAQTEVKPVAVGGKKAKVQGTGDLLADAAVEVENLTKPKALALADSLSEIGETSMFRMGGVLKVIKDNTWFEGYADFDAFVMERYGFASRKAAYLIQIYVDLVTKQIPWAKVSHLGWTKLKDLSPILTLENLDEWVAKATALTVLELQAALKAKQAPDSTTKATDEFVKLNLKVKPDQKSMIDTAIAKAKGELNTEFDSVALENICAAYVAGAGGTVSTVDTSSLDAMIKSVDFMVLITRISELSPEWDIAVDKAKAAA